MRRDIGYRVCRSRQASRASILAGLIGTVIFVIWASAAAEGLVQQSSLPSSATVKPFFPLESGDEWTYRDSVNPGETTRTTVLTGTVSVNGVSTKAMENLDPDGNYTNYMTNDENGIRLHRQDFDGDSVIFSPPAVFMTAIAQLGQQVTSSGTARLTTQGQTFNINYNATGRVLGTETVSVPVGVFETYKVEITLNLNGTINGQVIDETEIDLLYLAEHVGAVRITQTLQGTTDMEELTSVFIDHDSDGVSVLDDAFPEDPFEQSDFDGDGIGDNADNDDDDDGVRDADDAFPLDGSETTDTDDDGIGDNADADDDGDGLSDEEEASRGTDPLKSDTDADGLTDLFEVQAGTNPLAEDTDGDGVPDGFEVAEGLDPNVADCPRWYCGGLSPAKIKIIMDRAAVSP
jgi:hypothetical protein